MVRKSIITGTVVALSLSLLVFAGCRQRGPHRGAEFMLDYMSEALDLTAEQQDQLEAIKEELFSKAKQLHGQKREHHDQFMALVQAEEIDPVQLKAMIAKQRAKMDEVVDLAVDRAVAFHATLSAEQKEKLAEKIEKFHRYHGRRFH